MHGQGLGEHWTGTCRSAPIAKIWRAGCIIRSVFLDDIATAFATAGASGNLMTHRAFRRAAEGTANTSLRQVVAEAALTGIPMPALSSALAYFDISRTARSTANLTQAQRDFFGAHGFERIDRPGVVAHGPWGKGG